MSAEQSPLSLSPNIRSLSLHSSTSSLTNPNNELRGSIELILGPMFSGKTTELCRRMKRYSRARVNTMMIKHTTDNRYTEARITTHDKDAYNGYTLLAQNLPLPKECEVYPVIGIDEGQFFPGLGVFCDTMATRGHLVIVAGLNSTFDRKPWPEISTLIALGPLIDSYTAVCDGCQREAEFSYRKTSSKELVLVGSSEDYSALCRKCYKEEAAESKRV